MTNDTINALGLTDRDLITSLLSSYYIIDYGLINKVNADGTVNVTHAVKQIMTDGTELPETVTPNVEVLTVCGAGFALDWDYRAGDRVLLLGMKDYVQNTDKVKKAESAKTSVHYDRATIKAYPLCAFSGTADVLLQVKKGKMTLKIKDTADIQANVLNLNGKSKSFVTWEELNTAMQQFVSLLMLHVHTSADPGKPTSVPVSPITLDISAAKTTTVHTGG